MTISNISSNLITYPKPDYTNKPEPILKIKSIKESNKNKRELEYYLPQEKVSAVARFGQLKSQSEMNR